MKWPIAVVLSLVVLGGGTSFGGADEPAVRSGDRPQAGQEPARDPSLDAILADAETAPLVAEALRCRDAGDDDAALVQLRRANAAVKKKHGANTPQQLPILDLAAEILFGAGRFAESVAPLERAVAIREPLAADGAGDHEVAIASSLLLLGRAYAETGNVGGARHALLRAAKLFAESLGEEHEATRAARLSLDRLPADKEAS